jgi:anti-anti-sigma factor
MNFSEPSFTGSAIALSGDLSIEGAAELRAALARYVAQAPEITFDLSAVTSADACTLQLLIAAKHSADATGKTLKLSGISEAVSSACADIGLSLGDTPGV